MNRTGRITRGHKKTICIICILLVVILTSPDNALGIPSTETTSLQTGPYVDEVIFKVMANQDQRMLALLNGEIEMDTSFFDPFRYRILDEDPSIDIYSALRNGYGKIVINCAKYPLNISGFRRAFAFAYNKTRVVVDFLDGYSIEHDSLVPLPNGFCIENQFDWHYYAPQPDIGNQILDDLNFTIDSGTGFRLAPDGSPFSVCIEYASCSCEDAGVPAQIGVDALLSLGINAESRAADFNDYMYRVRTHGEFDMVQYVKQFYDNDVDWLAYEYWSEYATVEGENPTNFVNSTYDSWRDQLLHGATYEEVYEAAAEMQKILHYNVPELVTYINTYMQAYRNDRFTGHIEDLGRYISGPWTMRKIHRIDGTPGGSIPVAHYYDFMSLNFFLTQSSVSASAYIVLNENLHSSLFKRDSNLNPICDLATEMTTETHSDNLAVPDEHIRFSIDIVQNATWSDGTPLTAEDVAFTFNYAKESEIYGNPIGFDLDDLFAVYAPSLYRVVLEFSTDSYWHFNKFAFDYIIPVHIFNNSGGIGYEGWNTWNPIFNQTHPFVTCGPFVFSDYTKGEYYKIERNPLFYYAANFENTTSSTNLEPTQSETNQSSAQIINLHITIASIVGGFSSIVILYCGVKILQKRRGLISN